MIRTFCTNDKDNFLHFFSDEFICSIGKWETIKHFLLNENYYIKLSYRQFLGRNIIQTVEVGNDC